MEGVSKIEKVIFLEKGLNDLDEIYICHRDYQDLLEEKVSIFFPRKVEVKKCFEIFKKIFLGYVLEVHL